MTENNPMDHIQEMPDIEYFIIHVIGDPRVGIEKHSDTFVKAMKDAGKKVEYYRVEGDRHGGPIPADIRMQKEKFILSYIK